MLSARCPRPLFFPFDALVRYLPNSERDKARIHQFGKKVFSWICFYRRRIWEEDILIDEIEELEKLEASETHPRTLNAKEVLITQKDGECVFPVAGGSAKLSGRDYEFQEPTLRRESTVRRENLTAMGKSFNLKNQKMTQKLGKTWSIQEDFIYRRHIEPRVQSYVPKEESFPIPLKYIDVVSKHKKNELMTIGMSTETEICQIRGRVSQDLQY